MKIEYRKLPPHWQYLVTRRQILKSIAGHETDVRQVTFDGAAHKPSKITAGLYSAGKLDARPHDGRWCFRLRFRALPDRVLRLASGDVATAILKQTEMFLASPPAATGIAAVPLECILFFRVVGDELQPSFSTKKVKSWLAALDEPWWELD